MPLSDKRRCQGNHTHERTTNRPGRNRPETVGLDLGIRQITPIGRQTEPRRRPARSLRRTGSRRGQASGMRWSLRDLARTPLIRRASTTFRFSGRDHGAAADDVVQFGKLQLRVPSGRGAELPALNAPAADAALNRRATNNAATIMTSGVQMLLRPRPSNLGQGPRNRRPRSAALPHQDRRCSPWSAPIIT